MHLGEGEAMDMISAGSAKSWGPIRGLCFIIVTYTTSDLLMIISFLQQSQI